MYLNINTDSYFQWYHPHKIKISFLIFSHSFVVTIFLPHHGRNQFIIYTPGRKS